jgi:uncharacterized protein YcfL
MFNKIILLLLLAGCSSNPRIETVTKIERVIVRPPEELLIVPQYSMSLDVDHATQRDIAQWILQTEERMQAMETQLKNLKKFFDGLH